MRVENGEEMKRSYVYMLTNRYHNVLYVGVTTDLKQRIAQHRSRCFGGFTARYNLDKLVLVEEYEDVRHAIHREKQIKSWSRRRKDELIAQSNPEWEELMSVD